MITVRALEAADTPGVGDLFDALSEADRTLIKEDLHSPELLEAMRRSPELRWVATGADGRVVGYAAVHRLAGWSDHVGELRVVVDPATRGDGVGRQMVQAALIGALGAGVRKVQIELVPEQERVITMFTDLGFSGEALLRDHIRDREGEVHDLIVLAYLAQDANELLETVGITDALA